MRGDFGEATRVGHHLAEATSSPLRMLGPPLQLLAAATTRRQIVAEPEPRSHVCLRNLRGRLLVLAFGILAGAREMMDF